MESRENNSPLSGICPIITEAMCHSQQHHSVNDADPWISPSLGKLHIGKKIMGNNQGCWRSRPVIPVKMLAIIVCRFMLQQKLVLLPVGLDSNVWKRPNLQLSNSKASNTCTLRLSSVLKIDMTYNSIAQKNEVLLLTVPALNQYMPQSIQIQHQTTFKEGYLSADLRQYMLFVLLGLISLQTPCLQNVAAHMIHT